ncbi:ABC transporter ATP-binding protein [Bradyrhizobium sp. AC87j1]|uniref:ABC transporter ATP-binding protein n=1 Tax=Bradyrhizobium sp. AC87j1 TaxID=2055894 RepID=UPI000CECBD5F|nr:ABC transporter ATP-binding protein [Bradyrhizobium sp. AC87j1]PPQ14399.1 ABC transporter ATP-binding protein [Bradyrhizobium sp. AC87j1]
MNPQSPLLSVEGLDVVLEGQHGQAHIVRQVSFQLESREVLTIIGESGSGKSTLARALMGMIRPRGGRIALNGELLAPAARNRMPAQRRQLGMVFQDIAAAFDPRFTVKRILSEPLSALRGDCDKATPKQLLDDVGLSTALLDRYPHELSGGQRQRVSIARALACSPSLLICDEAVSALDLSVQAQILNLLSDLQERRGLAFLFITHDVGVVEYFADRIAVMYRGELLECGPAAKVLDFPKHPYTHALLASAKGTTLASKAMPTNEPSKLSRDIQR